MVTRMEGEINAMSAAEALGALCKRYERAMDRATASYDLSCRRLRLLQCIESHGDMRSADIARTIGHSPRTITETIHALERIGFVVREADPVDRRAKRITATNTARQAIAATAAIRDQVIATMFATLDDDERDTLMRLIEKLSLRLGSLEQ